jgi:hypothetical protein
MCSVVRGLIPVAVRASAYRATCVGVSDGEGGGGGVCVAGGADGDAGLLDGGRRGMAAGRFGRFVSAHLRLGADRAEGTTRTYAGDLACYLRWCRDRTSCSRVEKNASAAAVSKHEPTLPIDCDTPSLRHSVVRVRSLRSAS